jgi:L-2-hydroxyglutarate oxidase LhgO
VDFDVVVVGAGAVGLSVGFVLSQRGQSVLILEQAEAIGRGVSSRSSEVIHSGIYYPTGSLRHRLCVSGRALLYQFLESRRLPHAKCGKLIVATEDAEIPRLEALAAQAQRNGLSEVRWVDQQECRRLEPEVNAVAALHCPESGIFDSFAYLLALQGEIEERQGIVALRTPFSGACMLGREGFSVSAGGESPMVVSTRAVVIAAGLGAQAAASSLAGFPATSIPPLFFGKGVYFRLRGSPPFQRLIYPLPVPGALGIHYVRGIHGDARFGPDLEFVPEEDYRVDLARAPRFYEAVRRYWPGLPDDALEPDYGAIRPKLHGPQESQPDFRIAGPSDHGIAALVALFGIESPGYTASLAIAEEVAAMLLPG